MAHLEFLTILLGGTDCDHMSVLQQLHLGSQKKALAYFGTVSEDNLLSLGFFISDVDSMLNDEG